MRDLREGKKEVVVHPFGLFTCFKIILRKKVKKLFTCLFFFF